ncbi:MAG: sigma-70 family RNA polymerase sigma factor [Planctomycetota bacterium]
MEGTDFELAQAFLREGDVRSFRELVDRHSGLVFHLACRLTRNYHEAEDVTQDVFLVILRKLAQYQEGRSFRAWSAAITVRTAQRAVRSRKRQERRDHAVTIRSGPDGREEQAQAERKETAAQVDRLLDDLEPEFRLPLALHYLEGFTHAEVGDALELPVGTVKSRIHRGLERLRAGAGRRGRELTLAALVPVLQGLPKPALSPGLHAALHALPTHAAAAGVAATTAAAVKGGLLVKSIVAGIAMLVAAVGAAFLIWQASTETLFTPEAPGAEPEGHIEEAFAPFYEPERLRPQTGPAPVPQAGDAPVGAASSGAGGIPIGDEAGPGNQEAGEGGDRRGVATGAGVTVEKKSGKTRVRRLSGAEGLRISGGIRIGGGGRSRFAPAGWSKWAPRPPKKGDCTVTGWVLDSAGDPVPGAVVYRMKPGTDRGAELKVSFGELVRVAQTDAAGKYEAKFLPAGEYYLAGNYKNVLNTDRGLFTGGAVKVSLMPRTTRTGVTIRLPVALSDLGSIRGRVVDEFGESVRRAEVFAGFFRTFSGDDGTFSIPVLRAGPTSVSASRTGYRPAELGVEIAGGRETETTLVLELLDKGEFSISGTVTDGAGNVVAGAAIYLMGAGRTLRRGKTDEHGAFSMEHVARKEVRLQVTKRGGFRSHIADVVLPKRGLNIVLEKNVVITGFVKSAATGEILDLFNIKVFREDEEGEWNMMNSQSRYSADGSYRVEGRCGRLLMEVEAPGHAKTFFEIEAPVQGEEIKGTDLVLEAVEEGETEDDKD